MSCGCSHRGYKLTPNHRYIVANGLSQNQPSTRITTQPYINPAYRRYPNLTSRLQYWSRYPGQVSPPRPRPQSQESFRSSHDGLSYHSRFDHADIFGNNEVLTRRNLNPNDALILAARDGDILEVNELLHQGATAYNSAAAAAAQQGYWGIVQELLHWGASDYNYLLTQAALQGESKMVQQLLYFGATNYNQALNAAMDRHPQIVRLIQSWLAQQ